MWLLILTVSIHVSSWLDNVGGVNPIAVYSQLWPCSWSWLSIFHCLAIDYTNFWVLAIDCVAFDSLSVSLMLWMQAATTWQYGDFIKVLFNGGVLLSSGTVQYGTWTPGSRTYRSELGHTGVTPTCSERQGQNWFRSLRLSLEVSRDNNIIVGSWFTVFALIYLIYLINTILKDGETYSKATCRYVQVIYAVQH